MEKTKNYKLLKPGVDDFYDVGDFNQNADIVDQELKRVAESVGEAVEEIRGEIADIDLGEIGEALDQKVDIKTMQAALDGKEPLIRNVEERLSLLNADTIPISDSLASKATKKITFANLKESLKTFFDSYYNKYVHPSYPERSTGLYKVAVDNTGHVNTTAAVQKTDITALGIPAQDTKYSHPTYTARAAGLYKTTVDNTGHVNAVSAVQKTDITALGIPGQDTIYTHPGGAGWNHIPAGGSSGQVLKWNGSGASSWQNYEGMEKIQEVTIPAGALNLVFALPSKYKKFEVRGEGIDFGTDGHFYVDFNPPDSSNRFRYTSIIPNSSVEFSTTDALKIMSYQQNTTRHFVARLYINELDYPLIELTDVQKDGARYRVAAYSILGRPSELRMRSGNTSLYAGAKFELWGGL